MSAPRRTLCTPAPSTLSRRPAAPQRLQPQWIQQHTRQIAERLATSDRHRARTSEMNWPRASALPSRSGRATCGRPCSVLRTRSNAAPCRSAPHLSRECRVSVQSAESIFHRDGFAQLTSVRCRFTDRVHLFFLAVPSVQTVGVWPLAWPATHPSDLRVCFFGHLVS